MVKNKKWGGSLCLIVTDNEWLYQKYYVEPVIWHMILIITPLGSFTKKRLTPQGSLVIGQGIV